MTNIVKFKEKKLFGKSTFYPNNSLAIQFAHLLGKKSLSYSDVFNISQLGFNTNIERLNNFNFN
jgi:hypothetical protein